ncbi:hypothetical protein CP8484711_2240A, partial [Chlamydia psittaci 84-8471/1]
MPQSIIVGIFSSFTNFRRPKIFDTLN